MVESVANVLCLRWIHSYYYSQDAQKVWTSSPYGSELSRPGLRYICLPDQDLLRYKRSLAKGRYFTSDIHAPVPVADA